MDISRKITMAESYLRSAARDFEKLGIPYPYYRNLIYAINNLLNLRSRDHNSLELRAFQDKYLGKSYNIKF